jgi:hypothetical protein
MFCKKMFPLGAEDLIFRDKPFRYLTGISRLQALFRVLVMDNNFFSDYRLGDDPALWELRFTIGFFVYLGLGAGDQVDWTDELSCGRDEIEAMLQPPLHLETNNNGHIVVVADTELDGDVILRRHSFICALRNWYHGCIRLLSIIFQRGLEDERLTRTVAYIMKRYTTGYWS